MRIHQGTILWLGISLLSACGRLGQERVPFEFRHSMIEDRAHRDFPARKDAPRPAADQRHARPAGHPWRGRAAFRCRELVGQRFAGSHREATARLLRACLGQTRGTRASAPDTLEIGKAPPRPGDLVVFHNSRDANANGKNDDLYSDVGLVVAVRGVRVSFIYLKRGKVRLGVLNRAHPHKRRLRGSAVQNTYLRIKLRDDPPGTLYLAGQLLAGFAAPQPGG